MLAAKAPRNLIAILRQLLRRGQPSGQEFLSDLQIYAKPCSSFMRPSPGNFQAINSCLHAVLRFLWWPSKKARMVEAINMHVKSLSDQYRQLKHLYYSFTATIRGKTNDEISSIKGHFERERVKLTYEYKKKISSISKESNRADAEERKSVYALQKDLEESFSERQKKLKKAYYKERAYLDANIRKLKEAHPLEWSPWSDPFWDKKELPEKSSGPPLIRIGESKVSSGEESFTIPASVRIIGFKNLLVTASRKTKHVVYNFMKVVILRILLTIPSGRLNFVFMDPAGLGSNLSVFMHLPGKVVGERIWTESTHIESKLSEAISHINDINQTLLRDEFSNIEEYNDHAGGMAQPYRIIVVLDFPMNFTETAAHKLLSIAKNGPKTGVYTIVMLNEDSKPPFKFDIDELKRWSTVINQKNDALLWKESDRGLVFTFEKLPSFKKIKRLLRIVGDQLSLTEQVRLPFPKEFEHIYAWWKKSSSQGLIVPIGLSVSGDIVYLFLGKGTKQHALIAGTTGSGKSVLLHGIITGLCINYSPDELKLYLVDFKKGIEFKTYAQNKLPHACVIAIGSERPYGLSVLKGLYAELRRRGDLFREKNVQSIEGFREAYPDWVMPRIVLLMDEFQELFTEDDKIAGEASLLLDRLVRQGRALGIHIILVSQTLTGSYSLSGTTMGLMDVRIAFSCTDLDSRHTLGDDNPHAKFLSRPGEAIYNDEKGRIGANTRFQAYYLPDNERKEYLEKVSQLSMIRKPTNVHVPIIFEGNAPSSMETNRVLGELITSSGMPDSRPPTLTAWLGEPISMKPHTAVSFARQPRASLLMIGNEKTGAAMILSAMVSLEAQTAPDEIQFHLVNLSRPEAEWNPTFNSLERVFPHTIASYDRHSVDNAVLETFESVKEREEADTAADKALFLILMGVHRAKKLRSDDGYTYPEAAEQLFYILNHGPETGVHVICWGDSVKNVNKIMGRNMYEFGFRVALQMTVNESNDLIDTSEAGKLGKYKAVLYDEERSGELETFRPYRLPPQQWIEDVGKSLRRRTP